MSCAPGFSLKGLIYCLIFTGLVASTVFFFTYDPIQRQGELNAKAKLIHATSTNIEFEEVQLDTPDVNRGSLTHTTSHTEIDKALRMLEPHEILQLEEDEEKWKRSRGYFSKEDFELYATYDDTTIWQLASEGDLLALSIWAKTLKKQGRDEEALQTKMIAAVYGSSEALTNLATSHQVRSWSESLSEQERVNNIKSMLVYAEVAAKRGDRNGVLAGLLELNHQDVELSPEDVKQIRNAANDLFASLEKQRESLGLESFNNDTNALMQVQMDYMISPLPNKHDWATPYLGRALEFVSMD